MTKTLQQLRWDALVADQMRTHAHHECNRAKLDYDRAVERGDTVGAGRLLLYWESWKETVKKVDATLREANKAVKDVNK